MASPVVPNKQDGRPRLTDKPGEAIALVSRAVDKVLPDEGVGANWGQVHHGNENGEETNTMKNKDHALKTRERFDQNSVDQEREQEDRKEDQRALPSERVVIGVIDGYQTLDDQAAEIRAGGG